MKIYQVEDWDPMASSKGDSFIAATYDNELAAQQDVTDRNKEAYDEWVGYVGRSRADKEPWLWKRARVLTIEVKSEYIKGEGQ